MCIGLYVCMYIRNICINALCYVYMYMHMCVFVRACVSVFVRMYLRMCECRYICIRMFMFMYAHTCVYVLCSTMYICMDVRMYGIYVYVYRHICAYKYIAL